MQRTKKFHESKHSFSTFYISVSNFKSLGSIIIFFLKPYRSSNYVLTDSAANSLYFTCYLSFMIYQASISYVSESKHLRDKRHY